jgi:hypothetical protein
MIKGNWTDFVNGGGSYYYDIADGRILAQVYNMAHTNIWGAKMMSTDFLLGHYITITHAKKAIEEHFEIENRTLIA